nr:hypothetical protein [uncultured Allomuricauda sp.]
MTYKDIQDKAKEELGRSIKTCWIADVKRELGLTHKVANNRISKTRVKYPCPEGAIKDWLLKTLKTK